MSSSPPKRKKHIASKFQPEGKRFRLSASKKGPSFAFCTVCGVDFAIAGSGVHEVKRHCETAEHKRLLDGVLAKPSILAMMARASTDSLKEKTIKSELFFGRFVAEAKRFLRLYIY